MLKSSSLRPLVIQMEAIQVPWNILRFRLLGPKRKPMHSYPRKLANQPHKETIVPEQSVGFNSPKTSILDQENKSPTSVLSTIGSDTLGSTDSGTPNGSSSPVSSVTRVHTSRFILTEPKTLPEEEEIHSSNGLVTSTSLDEQPLRKFELFPEGSICAREDRTEEPTTCQTIKLFGRTVLITDSHRPCSPGMSASKSMASSIYEENSNQTLPCNFLPMESSKPDKECVSNKIEHRTNGALYLMQFQTHNLNSVEAGACYFCSAEDSTFHCCPESPRQRMYI
ncbi:protein REVEILLE 1-like isoform X1 [Quillaja saponaria]|uniref:Protein REVEILLE 1-like isoform X1 n=1 Tax=Quillaja saponaria TaxID=32244 RepID=A0AAD7LUP7_QUISA|nr:protein REVEILLE 1-like isoform X1 [Quillaja saponaria]